MQKDITKNCSFKLAHYQACLAYAKEHGYKFLTFEQYIDNQKKLAGEPIILMRHDIDHKLQLAENFATIEKKLGIQTTYFIRLHADYNLYNFKCYRTLKNLTQMGHEIGLHHDAGFAHLFDENAKTFFKRDKAVIEAMIDKKIVGISCHEPNNSKGEFNITDNNIAQFDLIYQAYSPLFLKEMKYISDSSARWREGCMCTFIKKEIPRLCILTHPIWWHDKSPIENY